MNVRHPPKNIKILSPFYHNKVNFLIENECKTPKYFL